MKKRTRQTVKTMENAKSGDPIDLKKGSPGQRSRLHAATAIQSSVKPEDYPKSDRDEQVVVATGPGGVKKG